MIANKKRQFGNTLAAAAILAGLDAAAAVKPKPLLDMAYAGTVVVLC